MILLPEPKGEPEVCKGVPDELPGVVPEPPFELGSETVGVGARNEVMAGVEPGEGAV